MAAGRSDICVALLVRFVGKSGFVSEVFVVQQEVKPTEFLQYEVTKQ